MPRAHLTYIVTAYGKPRSTFGLGNAFAEWATQAGLPPRCRLHGLKKGGMRRLAEAGNNTRTYGYLRPQDADRGATLYR